MATTNPTDNKQITNPTPKQRFMESADNISRHRSMIDSREFQRGLDFALLEYQHQCMRLVNEPNSAASMGLRLRGVYEFLDVFRLLGENVKITAVPRVQDSLPETPAPK